MSLYVEGEDTSRNTNRIIVNLLLLSYSLVALCFSERFAEKCPLEQLTRKRVLMLYS